MELKLKLSKFDHCFVLNKRNNVELSEINSGRKINVYTDQPIQVYTGNHFKWQI